MDDVQRAFADLAVASVERAFGRPRDEKKIKKAITVIREKGTERQREVLAGWMNAEGVQL